MQIDVASQKRRTPVGVVGVQGVIRLVCLDGVVIEAVELETCPVDCCY